MFFIKKKLRKCNKSNYKKKFNYCAYKQNQKSWGLAVPPMWLPEWATKL